MPRIKIKGPYLDLHDLWSGLYWHREGSGIRIYWCPLPAVVIRADIAAE